MVHLGDAAATARGLQWDRCTEAGIIVAFSGGALIAVGDAGGASAGSKPLLGDLLALGGALTVSLYLIFGREAQHRGLGLGQHVATAYVVGRRGEVWDGP
jgi:hypothetical protein